MRPAVATTDDGDDDGDDDDDDLRSVDACDMLYENTVTIMPSMQSPGGKGGWGQVLLVAIGKQHSLRAKPHSESRQTSGKT